MKVDRRVRYTKKMLNESLLGFLERKEITRITVTEICADADVNRSTYYAHFSDPYDQLGKLKQDVMRGAADYVEQLETGGLADEILSYRLLKSLLEYIDTRRNVFRILMTRSGDHQLQQDILKILGERIFSGVIRKKCGETQRRYYMLYVANGCFGMFYDWLMEEDPVESDILARMMADFAQGITGKE